RAGSKSGGAVLTGTIRLASDGAMDRPDLVVGVAMLVSQPFVVSTTGRPIRGNLGANVCSSSLTKVPRFLLIRQGPKSKRGWYRREPATAGEFCLSPATSFQST